MFNKGPRMQSARKWRCLAIGMLAFAIACESQPELLNSDRIERQFGSYGVEILQADARQRVSCLYSVHSDGRICRSVAIVDFAFPVDDRISAEHRAIIAGASIGQTFRDSGWRIEKETLVISETGPEEYAWGIAGLMRIDSKQPLAIHRYRFVVAKGRLKIYYASITEIHHPEYMNVRQLRAIF